MKYIFSVFIALITLTSCGEKSSTKEDAKEPKKEVTDNTTNYVDLDKLSESELKKRVTTLENKIYDASSKETNRENSIKLLEASNKFAERFPKSADREAVLYRGSLAARGLEKYFEAIRIFDVLIKDYPKSERYPDYVYEKAFICDEHLKNKEQAKKLYQELAHDYPNHIYGEQSKERLKTIDMTEEEFLNFLKNKNAES